MKSLVVLVFMLSLKTLFAQKEDSLFFRQLPDSIIALPNFGDSSLHSFTIPNCSELIKANGIWHWYNDPSPYSISFFTPYCGTCVVKFDMDSTNAIGYEWYVPTSSPYMPPGCPTLLENNSHGEIKIISNYNQGKRHGSRMYYNREGQLIKTETYENGILVSTKIHQQ